MRAYLMAAGRRVRAWIQGCRCWERGERGGTGPELILLTGCPESMTGCPGSMTAAGGSARSTAELEGSRQPGGENILGLGFGALLGCVSQVNI